MIETSVLDDVYILKKEEKKECKEWKVQASKAARNCKNYIRDLVDDMDLEPNPEKSVIALSLGDPTVYGNLKPPEKVVQAVIDATKGGKHNGYAPCVGFDDARGAVAEYLSTNGTRVTSDDVILCSGCSSSLDLCITVLADEQRSNNILMPKPGFPIYRTLAESIGVKVKAYNLIPEKDWEVDLHQLEAQIDDGTAAIVVNNPSNPCGSVYDEDHLRSILALAYKYKVPVIADEIYENLVFPEKNFVSMMSLNVEVPILVCGGLAKRFLVPGWRLGWIVVYDPVEAFGEVRKGLRCLSQRTIGSNTVMQGALPAILSETSQTFHDDLINVLYENAKFAFDAIFDIPGLVPYMPDGAMYMMIRIRLEHFPEFESGLVFMTKLMEEESVFCLPGDCFDLPGFMRIVITLPKELMKEACERMASFCKRHYTRSD